MSDNCSIQKTSRGLQNKIKRFCARKNIDFVAKRLSLLLFREPEKATCDQHILLSIIYINLDLKGPPAG